MKNKTEELIELEVEGLGFEGVSIARKNGQVYFVRSGIPGDVVMAQVRKKHKGYIETSIKKIIKKSDDRTEPYCQYFGACGGCTWQCLTYEKQLEWKKTHVIDAYQRIGKVKAMNFHNTMPAQKTLEYRNKMDFSFSNARWLTTGEIESGEDMNRHFALGLHVPGRYDKVLDIQSCKIQNSDWNNILSTIREKALELDVPCFNTYKNIGFLKGLTLRYSRKNDEYMSILITTSPENEKKLIFLDWYNTELCKIYPKLVSVVHAQNTQNSVNTGEIISITGKPNITENILGIDYQISPFSFFQTNSYQLDSFVQLIIDTAKVEKSSTVWDLYCGTGSITLPMSKGCNSIYGIELSEMSIHDAKKNAANNDINNAHFFTADLHNSTIPTLLNSLPAPDVVVIDPPRNGMHNNLIKHLLNITPERIIYVSCNPATQARDLSELSAKYDIYDVRPVDMFPHTYHIEVITELIRK